MVNRTPAAMRLLLLVSAWALAMPGFAQTATDPGSISVVDNAQAYTPEPAHIAFIDGVADVTRDGRAEPASINVPLVSGDQVRTKDGRMEVLFGDGSVLDLDHFTTVDFLSDELVRLTDGCIRLTIGGRERVAYRVDTPSAAVRIEAPGEYRIALVGESGRRDVELVAVRGYATLVNEFGETNVRAGERAFATSTMAPSYAQAYNSAAWDAFDRWSAERSDERTGATSARYLPDEIRGYAGDFDRYGAWQYDAGYGYVWYPRVRVDWRPYYYGRWSYYGPWGWTWIAYDRWGWPTHHYGRWGLRAGLWFWIPSRRWAPAYVYWAGASDYIGWCPLGWDNRPLFSIINVNIGRGYRGYDPYRAWTVMPRYAFRNHVDVGRYAVARNQIDRAVPRWFVSGASAPIRPSLATRDVSPIYSAGRGLRTGSSVSSPRGALRAGTATQVPGFRSADRDRAVPRDSAATREYRAGAPARDMPRATAPATPGALGPSTNWGRPGRTRTGEGWPDPGAGRPAASRATPRSAPYRDAGPGGPEPRYAPPVEAGRSPYGQPYGRSRPGMQERNAGDAPDYGRGVGAPRGVPNGGIYGERGVPRQQDNRGYAPRGVPRGGVYSPPPSQRDEPPATYYPAPSRPSRGRPEGYGGGGGGVYAPRSSGERPSYGAPSPPSAPRSAPGAGRPGGGDRGNDRGGDRAAPRGGQGTSRPSGQARPRPR